MPSTQAVPTQAACPAAPMCTPISCMPSCPSYCCRRNEIQTPKSEDSCPALCYKECAPICPRRCCGPHPRSAIGETRPNIHISDLRTANACPSICRDVCALECPHRCCGPGSFKRNHIAYPYRRIRRYNQYRKIAKKVSNSYIRRFGLPKL